MKNKSQNNIGTELKYLINSKSIKKHNKFDFKLLIIIIFLLIIIILLIILCFFFYYQKTIFQKVIKCLNNSDKELCIYYFISPKKVVDKKKTIIGPKGDGGYMLLNDLQGVKIAYSFGIQRDVSFEKALANMGINVFMYDHTIDSLPEENPKFHWKKIGLGSKSEKNIQLKTLPELLLENNHLNESNIILKLDIEHYEQDAFEEIQEELLNKFKYIVGEFHFYKAEKLKQYYDVLKKLNKAHQVFHVHCNNYAGMINFGNNRMCEALEISYIIKKGNNFTKDESYYPNEEFNYKSNPNGKNLDEYLNILKLFNSNI